MIQFKLSFFLLSGDAVPKLSSDDSVPDEPRLLLYLNRELSTSVQTGWHGVNRIPTKLLKTRKLDVA